MLVDPADDRHADRITESVEVLDIVADEGEALRPLQAGVFAGGHPPHLKPALVDDDDDLTGVYAEQIQIFRCIVDVVTEYSIT